MLALFASIFYSKAVYIFKKQSCISVSYDIKSISAEMNIFNTTKKPVYRGPLHYQYKYDINQIHTCNSSLELLIFVTSAPYKRVFRDAIRSSWASKNFTAKYNTKVLFLFGWDVDKVNNNLVEEESKQYQDIVRANFVDKYENLTLKSLAMLNWVLEYCRTARFLVKSDDDLYVNLPVILSDLRTFGTTKDKFLLGRIHPIYIVPRAEHVPKHNKKWIVSREEYPDDNYPEYLLGSAYAMTLLTVPDLYKASMEVPYLKIEDVFVTGVCANKVGIRRIEINCLVHILPCKLRVDACSNDSRSPKEIAFIHKVLRNSTLYLQECKT